MWYDILSKRINGAAFTGKPARAFLLGGKVWIR
jgi:hypothetical protein